MNDRVWAAVGAAAALGAGLAPAETARAQSALSAPSREQRVQIVIPARQSCFRHDGAGTHFTGRFRRGQRIVATSTGDTSGTIGEAVADATTARGVYVNWGGDEDQFYFEGMEPWVAPVTGRYTFSYSPTSMMGGRGVFIVCAR